MKIDRLIGIITILLQRDKVTAPELSERFEVSRRTINRDIEDLCRAGIPIAAAQGFGGGFSIADGYKIDKSLFTQDELQSLIVGIKGIDSVSKTSYLTAMIEKLSGKSSRVIANDLITIDLASHYQASLIPKIDVIKKAIQARHILTFRYYYEKGECRRRIEPYRLVFKWSSWYVFGYCLEKEAYRLFKLNRLWDLQTSEDSFADRDIPKEETEFEDYFTSGKIHLNAVFAESEKHRLIDEYGIDCYSVHSDGKLQFEYDFTNYENLQRWIFSFGDKVYVIEPGELQQDRIHQAENILKNNLSE